LITSVYFSGGDKDQDVILRFAQLVILQWRPHHSSIGTSDMMEESAMGDFANRCGKRRGLVRKGIN
jgi:hypothetical protein